MNRIVKFACLFAVSMLLATTLWAQGAATADLRGSVKDPNGSVVSAATVTLRDDARNISRTVKSNAEGDYLFRLMPPGSYTLSVDAPGFAKFSAKNIRLTIGQMGEFPIQLKVAAITTELDVYGTASTVETQRTAMSNTVDQGQIDNLPINQRTFEDFAKTSSTVDRDNGRAIGPAPTSGLNIGGQRGRSTLVQVDGADNTDASVNASRSTLSQDAVQEFQVITNSYSAEYGRASGGVINVVSKSGTNNFHGNLFGFLRNRDFQAKPYFSPISNPAYTRTQYGATLGGPIVKGKTFFFGAFEQRRRQESGFFTSNVAQGLDSSVTLPAGILPFPVTFNNITQAQAAYINGLLATGNPALINAAIGYGYLASSGGNIGLNGTAGSLISLGPAAGTPITAGTPIGPRFYLSGAPVPSGTVNAAGLPIAFRPLSQLQKIFPVSDGTTFSSLRIDHHINDKNTLTLRGSFDPSLITGIQVESQNQSLGQNDFSRTGVQQFRDWAAVAGLNSVLTNNIVNELNFNYGRRSTQFRSQNGDAVADNIAGTAFFGRELFSPVKRVETRYQLRDSLSWSKGHHLLKFGGDLNFVNVDANFQLNFAGLFNFGGLSASTLNPGFAPPGCIPACAPDFTPVQQYGLGFPSNFIQGFGNPNSSIGTHPYAFFAQDTWQLRPGLTLNFGVRYDIEHYSTLKPDNFTDPLSGITLDNNAVLAAQNALNVRQGVPDDNNNIAPRVGFAWDPWNNGRTVIRGAYGLFYDHPLLAIGFNSDIADSVQQQQFIATPGSPSPTALLNAVQVFQGTVCVPGATPTPVCAALPPGVATPGVASSAQYQFGRQRFNDQTFPGYGTVLPFSLPVTNDFVFGYANQANFSFEHQFNENVTLQAGYLFVGGRHLPRPIDVNAPENDLLIQNFIRFAGVAPKNPTQALAFSIPAPGTPGYTVIIPGMVAASSRGVFVNPAIANYFRPNAPNYFLASALSGGLVSKAVLDAAIANSLRTPGVIAPYSSVNAQSSTGTSDYSALNVDLKTRVGRNFQGLASYTWSHSIDDSSDLQTLLLPQDNRNLRAERAQSLFDQRHRFVFSGVLTSPQAWGSEGGAHRIFSNFTVAPIVELSAGRPFNILTNVDTNNDQSNQTDRPNVGLDGVLLRPPDFDTTCQCFPAGNLRRDAGITHGYVSIDLRIARNIKITERLNLNVIAEGFNLLNRFNEAAASPFFTDVNAFDKRNGNSYYSQPTAAFDPRQFQFGLKMSW